MPILRAKSHCLAANSLGLGVALLSESELPVCVLRSESLRVSESESEGLRVCVLREVCSIHLFLFELKQLQLSFADGGLIS